MVWLQICLKRSQSWTQRFSHLSDLQKRLVFHRPFFMPEIYVLKVLLVRLRLIIDRSFSGDLALISDRGLNNDRGSEKRIKKGGQATLQNCAVRDLRSLTGRNLSLREEPSQDHDTHLRHPLVGR